MKLNSFSYIVTFFLCNWRVSVCSKMHYVNIVSHGLS